MGIIDGLINAGSQLWTNKVNREENRKARNWNLSMWKMENEYNTPANQMARFKEAGLNPNLIYGQGNAGNAGSVSSVSPYQAEAPTINLPNAMEVLRGYQEYLIKNEVIEEQKWKTGITRNMWLDTALKNFLNYGDLIPTGTVALGKGGFANEEVSSWYKPFGGHVGFTERKAEAGLNLSNQLARIRKSEADMSDSIKKYNLTSADAWWARIIARFMDETSIKKLIER